MFGTLCDTLSTSQYEIIYLALTFLSIDWATDLSTALHEFSEAWAIATMLGSKGPVPEKDRQNIYSHHLNA